MRDLVPVRRALISLSDKSGLGALAEGLKRHGVEIVSTGGTAGKLRESGADVRDISDLTGFPEMMDGRVKTLHPKVHGGLLGVRDNRKISLDGGASDRGDRLGRRQPRPFAETLAKGVLNCDTIIENIDIGGTLDGLLGGEERRPRGDRHRSEDQRRAAGRAGCQWREDQALGVLKAARRPKRAFARVDRCSTIRPIRNGSPTPTSKSASAAGPRSTGSRCRWRDGENPHQQARRRRCPRAAGCGHRRG